MKLDEQDRVRDHALGFYLAFFLVIQPTQIFLSKPTRTERARQKWCIPGKSLYTFAQKRKTHEQKLRCDNIHTPFFS